MTEITEEREPDGEDLIPKDQLPTDPAELDKGATATHEEEAEESEPTATPEEKPEVHSQPKPVEGETPKEKALRLEVQRLRGEVRRKQVGDLVETKKPVTTDEYQELRDKGYTDEQIVSMESAVDIIATKKGYVRADRTYAQTVQDTVDLFTEEHPEYKPNNDAEDVRWNLFQSLLKDGTYNLSGKTPKQLKSVFDKVDADVRKEFGEVTASVPSQTRIAAAQHRVAVASHAGGTKGSPAAPAARKSPTHAGGIRLVGFDDDDFS